MSGNSNRPGTLSPSMVIRRNDWPIGHRTPLKRNDPFQRGCPDHPWTRNAPGGFRRTARRIRLQAVSPLRGRWRSASFFPIAAVRRRRSRQTLFRVGCWAKKIKKNCATLFALHSETYDVATADRKVSLSKPKLRSHLARAYDRISLSLSLLPIGAELPPQSGKSGRSGGMRPANFSHLPPARKNLTERVSL
jgi:hypothetical protein